MRKQNLPTPLFAELLGFFGLSLPALTPSWCFLGYKHIQANQSARFKRVICGADTDLA